MRLLLYILLSLIFVLAPIDVVSASIPCLFGKKTVSCRELGMVANDYESRVQNTKKLIQAINAGYRIVCDNSYYLGRNHGDIVNGITITGDGMFILDGSLTITHEIPTIDLMGVTFISYDIYSGKRFDEKSPTCAFLFANNELKYKLKEIVVRNCKINNISLIRFPNRSGDYIKRVVIEGNEWRNMNYVGIGIISTLINSLTITNNKAYKVKSRLFDFASATTDKAKIVKIADNYLSNKGFFSNTNEFYAGLAVVECEEAICENNLVEDFLVANKEVNLYDIYCNSRHLVYRNNHKHNVLNFQDNNLLCKAKGFIDENGSKIVESNSFIVDDDIVQEYKSLITPDCSVSMLSLSPNEASQQERLVVRNNLIKASVPCSFGMSGGANIKEVIIENNTIECKSVSSGNYFYRGIADNVIIAGNTISPKEKVTTNTPAVNLLKGNIQMSDCSISAFPGAVTENVNNKVINSSFTFTYSSKASPHLSLGGMVKNCDIDFQRLDLTNNYNIYLSRAKNELEIKNLVFRNTPTKGTLWLRYLLDSSRSSDYILMKIVMGEDSFQLLINNIDRTIEARGLVYRIGKSLQSFQITTGQGNYLISFYEDRLGISDIKDGMSLLIKGISQSEFNMLKKVFYNE